MIFGIMAGLPAAGLIPEVIDNDRYVPNPSGQWT